MHQCTLTHRHTKQACAQTTPIIYTVTHQCWICVNLSLLQSDWSSERLRDVTAVCGISLWINSVRFDCFCLSKCFIAVHISKIPFNRKLFVTGRRCMWLCSKIKPHKWFGLSWLHFKWRNAWCCFYAVSIHIFLLAQAFIKMYFIEMYNHVFLVFQVTVLLRSEEWRGLKAVFLTALFFCLYKQMRCWALFPYLWMHYGVQWGVTWMCLVYCPLLSYHIHIDNHGAD